LRAPVEEPFSATGDNASHRTPHSARPQPAGRPCGWARSAACSRALKASSRTQTVNTSLLGICGGAGPVARRCTNAHC